MKNEHIINSLSKNKLLEPPYLYRFRKLCHIFQYKELEKEEIYFPSPEELNDPVENLTNLFWEGDEIAWKGLFKHYIIILAQWELFEIIMSSSSNTVLNTNQLFHSVHQLPTKKYKDKILNIYSKFFAHPNITELIHFLGNRKCKIRKSELQFYLTITLRFIRDLIFISNGGKGNYNDELLKKILNYSFFTAMKEKENQLEDEGFFDTIFDIGSSVIDYTQMMLCIALKNYDITQTNKRKIPSLMVIDNYLSILESITFPYWCTASFTQYCNNPSVWGHYSDGHKGICLKFKTQKIKGGGVGLPMTNTPYFNTQSESVIPFTKIFYQRKYPECDFFRSMGILPRCILENWFSDEKGNQSSSADLMQNEELWRNHYWKNFYQKKISIKLKEWKYENEYRLIIPSCFRDIQKGSNRLFKYKFSSLEGIIFGIKTPDESKLEIMKIIFDKCKKESRADFKFYQACYNSKNGLIKDREMAISNLNICSEIKK